MEVDEGDARDGGVLGGGEGEGRLGGVAEEAGDGRVRDRASARTSPPIALGVGRDIGGDALAVALVEELDRDLVAVAVGRLHLVRVEAGREEEDLLAPRGLQHVEHVGGDPAAPAQRSEGRGLEDREVTVAAPHPHHGQDLPGVALVGHHGPVVDREDLHPVEGVHEASGVVEVAGALAEHGEGLVHPHHHARGAPSREPLHLHLDPAHVHVAEVDVEVGQVGSATAEAVAAARELGQGPRDVDEVLVRVPALAHPLDVELEHGRGQAPTVEHTHAQDDTGGSGVVYL